MDQPAIVTVQHPRDRNIVCLSRFNFFVAGLAHSSPNPPTTIGIFVAVLLHVRLFPIDVFDRLRAVENALVNKAAFPICAMLFWRRRSFRFVPIYIYNVVAMEVDLVPRFER